MPNYLTGLRPWILLILSVFLAGYAGAYPYLDPNHFDWRNGIIAFILAATTFAVYHINHTDTHAKLDGIQSSLQAPATRRPNLNEPPYTVN